MKRFVVAVWLLNVAVAQAQTPINFNRQIRPLLAEKCFACHGPDEQSRKGELRLDTPQGLFGRGDSGKQAVVSGHATESEVVHRLRVTDDERMPPAESGKTLTDEQIALICQWIDQGANWQQHWSLVPPQRPEVPNVADNTWPRNNVDRFVLARLEAEGLRPEPEADKETLLRRVTLDLTGLPPTPEEIREFLTDASPDAYERVVDRLLKSKHYGEHRARYWLDVARYGDTHGLHLDNYRMIWPYRDYVIAAFNQNMPFDQFTIEQLAGDLLPHATQEQLVATGFNRCNVTTSEGGALPEEYEVYYANDRVATIATAWMGVSMGCCVCHDHKFDPFSMRDFYQLTAFYNSLDGPVMDGNAQDTAPTVRVMNEEQRAQSAMQDQHIRELEQAMNEPHEGVDAAQREWEADYRDMMATVPEWTVLRPDEYSSARSAAFERLPDNSLLVSGTNANQDVYEIIGTVGGDKISAVRLEGLSHPSLTAGGAGRSENSNVVLTEIEVEYAPATANPPNWEPVKLTRAWADHEQSTGGDFRVGNAIDGKPETGWAIDGHHRRDDRTAIFASAAPFGFAEGTRVRIRLRHESVYAQHQFGRVRLATTSAEHVPELDAKDVPTDVGQLVNMPVERRDDAQNTQVRDFYRNSVSQDAFIRQTRDALAAARKERREFEQSLPTSLIWRDAEKTKTAHILTRGAYDKPGDAVARNTPAVLPPLPPRAAEQSPTRLDLAKWLLSPSHPLTARVTVNRYWQQYFGAGIVESSEDFGSQGTAPSHPDLLDWLAVEFRESGWNTQRFHKMIVMSATYRQSAVASAEKLQQDPRNRLLARGPRFRMDAEMVRDLALSASGLLVPTIGGPSVKPYQPEGIWEAVGYTDSNTANFTRDNGSALYRRSVYTFWKRTAPPPALSTLDAPSRETCTVRRSRTNTPLAALALMNDVQFVEASRALGQRLLKDGGASDAGRFAYGYLLVVGRQPSEKECLVLQRLLDDSRRRYRDDEAAAKELIGVGESVADATVDPRELASWTIVGNLLVNLDETVNK